MLNFGASKPRVKGEFRATGAPLDPRLWPHATQPVFEKSDRHDWKHYFPLT